MALAWTGCARTPAPFAAPAAASGRAPLAQGPAAAVGSATGVAEARTLLSDEAGATASQPSAPYPSASSAPSAPYPCAAIGPQPPYLAFAVRSNDIGPDGNPGWSLIAQGYPARLEGLGTTDAAHTMGSGSIAVVWHEDHGLATMLNLHVARLDVARNQKIADWPILEDHEMRVAALEPNAVTRESMLRDLARLVDRRMRDMNQRIGPSAWRPLTPCPEPSPNFGNALSTVEQMGTCGGLEYRYRGAHLQWTARGATRRLELAELRAHSSAPGGPVRDALIAAYVDDPSAATLLLLNVGYVMGAGGDGFGEPERWRAVRLGR